MSDTFENKGTLATTIVVAAADSLNQGQANYVCDGVNDQVEIQAALDALPATGGEVKLLDGTYNCEATIDLDSYQTLRGCGRNTLLTTSTAVLIFLSAVGASGTELTEIVIADIKIDGNIIGGRGIYFDYVDFSLIQNVYVRNLILGEGIYLENSDFNTLTSNTGEANGNANIYLLTSTHNNIAANTSTGAQWGIYLNASHANTIISNTCENSSFFNVYLLNSHRNNITGNGSEGGVVGIALTDSDYNTITGNAVQGAGHSGIEFLDSDHNTIVGNTLIESSQDATNTYPDIWVQSSSYNNIQGNTCRAGALVPKPSYGIVISNAACLQNLVAGNDLYDDGFGTAPFNDAGTLTTVKSSNRGIQITQVRDYVYIKNTSGGASAVGDVARHKAVAAGNEYDTPAANGEDSVLGMVAEIIANNASGLVQVAGKTTVLKATNAGGNIAIGDYLCTENGVRARLAAAGDMSFARALEVCAAANCTIDALIISPMKM